MSSTASLPIIDFGKWKGSAEERQQVAEELADACRHVGFVYIINHGVEDELLDEAFGWSKKLFDLPEEKKMLAPHPPGKARKSTSSFLLMTNMGQDPTCTEATPGQGSKRFRNTSIRMTEIRMKRMKS